MKAGPTTQRFLRWPMPTLQLHLHGHHRRQGGLRRKAHPEHLPSFIDWKASRAFHLNPARKARPHSPLPMARLCAFAEQTPLPPASTRPRHRVIITRRTSGRGRSAGPAPVSGRPHLPTRPQRGRQPSRWKRPPEDYNLPYRHLHPAPLRQGRALGPNARPWSGDSPPWCPLRPR